MSPALIVQRQLDAYNARDIDAFCELFHLDAQIFDLGSPSPSAAGLVAIRERYRQLFARSPFLHSELLSRIEVGRAVVDHERIAGRNGSPDSIELLAIYEVVDGLIRRLHVVWP
jgi:hypothetical protein